MADGDGTAAQVLCRQWTGIKTIAARFTGGTGRMSIVSWIEERLLRGPQQRRDLEVERLQADLRILRADAEALRARGRVLRCEIANALANTVASSYGTSAIVPFGSRRAQ